MRSGDVNTGKFASWPLLRPDELASLPSEVLKASLAALDLLCGQTSDGELANSQESLNRVLSLCNGVCDVGTCETHGVLHFFELTSVVKT